MVATTIERCSFLHSTYSLCFISARHRYNETSQVRVLHGILWKCNCSFVLSKLKTSKFYQISSVLKKILPKFFRFVSFVDTVYINYYVVPAVTCRVLLLVTSVCFVCLFVTVIMIKLSENRQPVAVGSFARWQNPAVGHGARFAVSDTNYLFFQRLVIRCRLGL